ALGDLCEPEDAARLAAAVGMALDPCVPASSECQSVEYQKLMGDQIRWLEARVAPTADGAALLVTRDISRQKWAEQEAILTRAVATAVSESDGLGSALLDLLGAVCDVTGWVLGGAWIQRMADS